MCKFRSMIVHEKLGVLELDGIDSHEEIIKHFQVNDDKSFHDRIVRVEINPLVSFASTKIEDWKFQIDQDNVPEWFNENKEDFEFKCFEKLFIAVKKGITKAGSVDVREGATLTAPALTEIAGSVDVQQGATLTAPALTKAGYVYVREGATLTAPALTKAGYVDVQQGATLTAPALKRK